MAPMRELGCAVCPRDPAGVPTYWMPPPRQGVDVMKDRQAVGGVGRLSRGATVSPTGVGPADSSGAASYGCVWGLPRIGNQRAYSSAVSPSSDVRDIAILGGHRDRSAPAKRGPVVSSAA